MNTAAAALFSYRGQFGFGCVEILLRDQISISHCDMCR